MRHSFKERNDNLRNDIESSIEMAIYMDESECEENDEQKGELVFNKEM